jgi:hypothetical protein
MDVGRWLHQLDVDSGALKLSRPASYDLITRRPDPPETCLNCCVDCAGATGRAVVVSIASSGRVPVPGLPGSPKSAACTLSRAEA